MKVYEYISKGLSFAFTAFVPPEPKRCAVGSACRAGKMNATRFMVKVTVLLEGGYIVFSDTWSKT